MGIVRGVTAALTGCALSAALVCTAPPAAATDATGLPDSIVALGDSITLGFDSCGFYVRCTQRSWSTGDDADVRSHRSRLLDLGAVLVGQANFAKTGARSGALVDQVRRAAVVKPDYVTLEIGANDACAATEAEMTPVADYRGNIAEALRLLHEAVPKAQVFVASLPDLRQLWALGHDNWYARKVWHKFGICQSMLERPDSFSPADVERRDRVRTRTILYNEALAAVCADYGPRCRFDDKAVFLTAFTSSQVSKWDYFHPSTEGQALLAEVTWNHGFFGRGSS